ncbi:unnamed protein product [Effrenium voratum]|uniref:Uncharacterized protein n=1 Tax=Effrenium voratum TaxID=2562239 RepID=A0AA36MJY7_9DINO|nr:unnamed protein product [Effrenium voratum]
MAKESVQLLGLAGDLAGLLSLLPLLSEAKFGHLLRAKESKESKEGAVQRVPPTWALLLLLAAECWPSPFFYASDKKARRAIGEVVRAQRNASSGFEATISNMVKLLENQDVYELTRLVAMCGGLLGICLVSFSSGKGLLGLPSPRDLGRLVPSPRRAAQLLLLALFVCGTWTQLGKLLRKPQAGGGGGECTDEGALSSWALFNCAACVARLCRRVLYEQATLETLPGSPELLAALALEAWCVLVLMVHLVRRRGKLLVAIALAAPCVMLAAGAPYSKPWEPMVTPALQKSGLAAAVVAAMLICMGGFPTMMCSLVLVQVLYFIHGLDNAKL